MSNDGVPRLKNMHSKAAQGPAKETDRQPQRGEANNILFQEIVCHKPVLTLSNY